MRSDHGAIQLLMFQYCYSSFGPGAISEFWSGGYKVASEASRNLLAPLCQFVGTPMQRSANFYKGGANH